MGLWKKQKSGIRMKSICFPPTAFEGPQVRRQAGASSERDLRYDCLLPTAFKEEGWKGHVGGVVALDKMSPPIGKERTRDVENRTSNAGMSLKTKDRCGKLGQEAGMSMKTNVVTR